MRWIYEEIRIEEWRASCCLRAIDGICRSFGNYCSSCLTLEDLASDELSIESSLPTLHITLHSPVKRKWKRGKGKFHSLTNPRVVSERSLGDGYIKCRFIIRIIFSIKPKPINRSKSAPRILPNPKILCKLNRFVCYWLIPINRSLCRRSPSSQPKP